MSAAGCDTMMRGRGTHYSQACGHPSPLNLKLESCFPTKILSQPPTRIHSIAVQEYLDKTLVLLITGALWWGEEWARPSQESLGLESKSPITPGSVVSWPAGLILPFTVNKAMWALQLRHIRGCDDTEPRGHRKYCSYR